MKTYFVDCKVEIGCAMKIKAKNEKEAIKLVKEGRFDYMGEGRVIDIAHYEIEADAMEMQE